MVRPPPRLSDLFYCVLEIGPSWFNFVIVNGLEMTVGLNPATEFHWGCHWDVKDESDTAPFLNGNHSPGLLSVWDSDRYRKPQVPAWRRGAPLTACVAALCCSAALTSETRTLSA